jgi:hypothetical protein
MRIVTFVNPQKSGWMEDKVPQYLRIAMQIVFAYFIEKYVYNKGSCSLGALQKFGVSGHTKF